MRKRDAFLTSGMADLDSSIGKCTNLFILIPLSLDEYVQGQECLHVLLPPLVISEPCRQEDYAQYRTSSKTI